MLSVCGRLPRKSCTAVQAGVEPLSLIQGSQKLSIHYLVILQLVWRRHTPIAGCYASSPTFLASADQVHLILRSISEQIPLLISFEGHPSKPWIILDSNAVSNLLNPVAHCSNVPASMQLMCYLNAAE